MLPKIAIVLLTVWIIGVVGLFEIGDLVHVLLLGGLWLLLLARWRMSGRGSSPQARSEVRAITRSACKPFSPRRACSPCWRYGR